MNSLASDTFPEEESNENTPPKTAVELSGTLTGGGRETKWKVVTKTAGLMTAEVIVGRLMAEGIPARAWQEGAGQALGLTVGLLGTGYVLVPEEYLDAAKEILESTADDDLVDDERGDESTSIVE